MVLVGTSSHVGVGMQSNIGFEKYNDGRTSSHGNKGLAA
jgi:hypothetical protein